MIAAAPITSTLRTHGVKRTAQLAQALPKVTRMVGFLLLATWRSFTRRRSPLSPSDGAPITTRTQTSPG